MRRHAASGLSPPRETGQRGAQYMRSHRNSRSLTFISTLLLTTALAAPAFAQIEEVVVTAQKKSEDIQSVPIAISAFTAQDLAAHQIKMSKDLQFSIPNVTFSNGSFGSS